jgi:uncharacterized protein YfkK (UPF0435 family)
MLLPDNIHPENTIYYNGAFVLESLQNKNIQTLIELYQNVKQKRNMSFSILILCLDWLYLIDVAEINEKGEVKLCL